MHKHQQTNKIRKTKIVRHKILIKISFISDWLNLNQEKNVYKMYNDYLQ